MTEAVLHTVQANNKKDGYIRLVVTRGAGSLGLDPRKTTDPQVIIIVDDISLYPPELYENGLEIVTSSFVRNHPNALEPRIKSLNYLNNILAKIEAVRAGCLEALMLNVNGEVAECTGRQHLLRQARRPPNAADARGHPRRHHAQLRHGAGPRRPAIPVQEITLTRHDVYSADECFLTGTGAEIIPVVKCDGRVIGTGKPGPITRRLRERFHQAVREEKGGQ